MGNPNLLGCNLWVFNSATLVNYWCVCVHIKKEGYYTLLVVMKYALVEKTQRLSLKSNDVDKIKDELVKYNNQINWLYLHFFLPNAFFYTYIFHRLWTYACKRCRIMVVLSTVLIWDNFLFYSYNISQKKNPNPQKTPSLGVHSQTSAGSLQISKLELWKPIPRRRKDITSEWYCSVEPIAIKSVP